MLDIKFIREHKDIVQAGARKKHIQFDVDELSKLDDERKALQVKVDEKRTQQNEASKKISKADGEEKQKLIDEMQSLKAELEKDERQLQEVMKVWQSLMVQVPNVPDISVPDGDSEKDNQEVRKWGNPPEFAFKPKNHQELAKNHDLADFERGAKVAGFRGYFLKNEGLRLAMALWQYAIEFFGDRGFKLLGAPALARREALLGTGYIPQGEEDLYKTQDNDYLVGTAEVPVMSYYADEVLDKEKLPIKFLAFSPCYRREAGSHGKDTKGLYRVHEFFKVEQVVLCEASHEESVKFHEELTKNSEEFMQSLGLPYRVVVNCGGDLGLGQVKKYDIEAWVPSEKKYRETHSSSYFHDFQTRRLNIRYKEEGKMKFAHSLNNTAVATPRILIQILENYQKKDGTIEVPEVLRKYVGQDVIGKIDETDSL